MLLESLAFILWICIRQHHRLAAIKSSERKTIILSMLSLNTCRTATHVLQPWKAIILSSSTRLWGKQWNDSFHVTVIYQDVHLHVFDWVMLCQCSATWLCSKSWTRLDFFFARPTPLLFFLLLIEMNEWAFRLKQPCIDNMPRVCWWV